MTGDWICVAVVGMGMLVAILLTLGIMIHSNRRMQESLARIRCGEARIAALTAKALGRDV